MENKNLRILYLAGHLSTGGMPSFLLKRIEAIQNCDPSIEISVVEYEDITGGLYVVHRKQIQARIRPINFGTLGSDKWKDMSLRIHFFNPDIIHVDEMLEDLADDHFIKMLYNPNRKYRIVETCHNVRFNPNESKRYHPDLYIFCTPFHEQTFAEMDSMYATIEFPVDRYVPNDYEKLSAKEKLGMSLERKSIVNVGLWTQGKNQGEGIEIARKYPEYDFYFVGNQAGNFQDYWQPLMKDLPSNVYVVGEKDVPAEYIIACDLFMFNSTWECNPIVLREAIGFDKPIIARNLPQYGNMFSNLLMPIDTDLREFFSKKQQELYHQYYMIPNDQFLTTEQFGQKHIDNYKAILKLDANIQKVKVIRHFVDNPYVEIMGLSDSKFEVEFRDGEGGECHYSSKCNSNTWHKLNRRYFTNWAVTVFQDGQLIYDEIFSLKGKNVFIVFETESLGDTLAWMHHCEIFRQKHDCNLFVSTYWNRLFDYPEINFIEPGATIFNLHALYRIGWFYKEDGSVDFDRHPEIPFKIPLIQTITDILGLEYAEMPPKIKPELIDVNPYVGEGRAAIATNSTLEMKFWQKEEWQKVIDHLNGQGYQVVNLSKEKNEFNGCPQLDNSSIEEVIPYIAYCDLFIGLSSGLSWLAWALYRDVYMIANFSEDWHEFDCYRFTNKKVCHGCWNTQRFVAGDWDYCPAYKNTRRTFECHRSIKAQEVIDKIEENRTLMIHH